MRLLPACCRRHFVQAVVLIQGLIAKSGKTRLPVPDLVALAQVRPQPFFNVAPYMFQGLAAVLEVEIANPTANGGIDCSNDQIKRHKCSPTPREGGNAILDRLQGLLRWLGVRIAIARPDALSHPAESGVEPR